MNIVLMIKVKVGRFGKSTCPRPQQHRKSTSALRLRPDARCAQARYVQARYAQTRYTLARYAQARYAQARYARYALVHIHVSLANILIAEKGLYG